MCSSRYAHFKYVISFALRLMVAKLLTIKVCNIIKNTKTKETSWYVSNFTKISKMSKLHQNLLIYLEFYPEFNGVISFAL